jgi:photosystem II stability/assembly factor-like uncharacterized protein
LGTLRDGQPQPHAHHLVYRRGLAIADDGRGLLMGSTSGGLWSTADAGDHWQAVSHHLPPAFAARFG